MGVDITTAIDSLVKLVNERGSISLEETSKILKIPENIINEWATFLEEEKVLNIEYKFTTPFLIAKKTGSGKEQVSKDEIELIKRKMEVMLFYIKNVVISEKEVKLNQQKKFLCEEIEKLIDTLKKVKDYNKLKEDYIKLKDYYNLFKKNSKG